MIDLSEFQKRKLALAFYRMDSSRDGYVERADWELQGQKVAVLRGISAGTPEHDKILAAYLEIWDRWFRHLDLDGDGKVTLDEYLDSVRHAMSNPAERVAEGEGTGNSVFDAVDGDADGVIGLEEFTVFLRASGCSEEDARLAFVKIASDGRLTRDAFNKATQDYHTSDDPSVVGNWFFGTF